MVASRHNSSVPENTSYSQRRAEMPCSSGDDSSTEAVSKASIVRCFAMNPKCSHLTLSERLTPLLITAGLVKGTTRTFARRLWRRGIRDFVSYAPDGSDVDTPKEGFLF